MIRERPEDYAIESGPMGPIGEGEALVLRINRNCPWNKCLFCPVYKGRKYSSRNTEEIVADIEAVRRTRDLILSESEGGAEGLPSKDGIIHVIAKHPAIYGSPSAHPSPQQTATLQTLYNVYRWMKYGAARVFLQDANAPAMNTRRLVQVMRYLKETFPSIEIITAYARSKTCYRKSLEELKMLKEAGLSWCFVGIESGCDEVLDFMKKGVTAREHAEGGTKFMASGIRMAAFVMPGLAGSDEELRARHVSGTVGLLNEIQPTEVRVRSLAVLETAPLYEKWKKGQFDAADDNQLIEEIRMIMEGLDYECTFETLQMTNPLFTVKGPLSQVRQPLRDGMDWYLALPQLERARTLFGRYVNEGYLEFIKAWGKYDGQLEQVVTDAQKSLTEGQTDAAEKVHRAIFALKSKGVP